MGDELETDNSAKRIALYDKKGDLRAFSLEGNTFCVCLANDSAYKKTGRNRLKMLGDQK